MRLATLWVAMLLTLAVGAFAAGAGEAARGTKPIAAKLAKGKPKPKKKAHTKPASRASAGIAGNLFENGSFETSLSGWQGYNATLARVSGGAEGASSARVSLRGSADNFSIYPSARPVTSSTAGTVYEADASVRTGGVARKVCLRVREFSSSSLVGSAQSCATTSATWRQLPPVTYTTVGSNHSLDAYVYVAGAVSGDSFDVDGLYFGGAASPVPTADPGTTTSPPAATVSAPPATAATATAVDNAHISLTWPFVTGAATYRVLRGTLIIGTTTATRFTDTLLWPSTTYTYTIQALSSSGALLATWGASTATTALPATGFPRPFAVTSFWNTPIASSPQLAPDDKELAGFLSSHAINPALSIGAWSVPVAESHSSDPSYTVPCTTYACTLGAFGPFRIPVTARADTSSDGHLAVYDPIAGREWDLWQAKSNGSSWSTSAGAAVSSVDSGVAPGNTAGADAANFPLLGGLIRPEEIAQGHIDHALVFGLPGVGAGAPVCPATHNASTSSDPSAPREGTHVQLDPSIDVSSLPIPAYAKIVARAMQVYGMYLRDSSGSLGVYAENPLGRGYNPWPSVLGIAAGNDFPTLAGIPWSKFRVLEAPDYPNC